MGTLRDRRLLGVQPRDVRPQQLGLGQRWHDRLTLWQTCCLSSNSI